MLDYKYFRDLFYKSIKNGTAVALIGQGCAFLSMVLPIFWQATNAIGALVFWGGLAAIGANFLTYGANVLLPIRKHSYQICISITYSLICLFFGTALFVIVLLLLGSLLELDYINILSMGFLLLGQGLYLVMTAVLVRIGSYYLMARLRLLYGCSSIISTIFCLIFYISKDSCLLWAIAFSFFGSSIFIIFVLVFGNYPDLRSFGRVKFRISYLVCYLIKYWRLAFSLLISNISFNASSLAVARMGPVGGHWAAILRVTGGVCTVGSQIVGPVYEMGLGSSMRQGKISNPKTLFLKILISGFLLTGLYCLLMLPSLLYLNWFGSFDREILYYGCAFIYACSVIPYSVANRLLLIAGGERWSLILAISKGLLVLILVYLFKRDLLIFFLVVLELFHSLIYFYLIKIRFEIFR